MAEPKTKKNEASVDDFIDVAEDETKRDDCRVLLEMMRKATGCEPSLWRTSRTGFGKQHFCGKSGRGSDWFQFGFPPRKQNLTLSIINSFEHYDELMSKPGNYSTGKSCLYIKRLSDVDKKVLNGLAREPVKYFEKKYGKN